MKNINKEYLNFFISAIQIYLKTFKSKFRMLCSPQKCLNLFQHAGDLRSENTYIQTPRHAKLRCTHKYVIYLI